MKNHFFQIKKVALCLSLFGATLLPSTSAWAEDSDSHLKVSGFLSIVGGGVVSGNFDTGYSGPSSLNGTACPCYIADWSNAGVYNKTYSLTPESRIGVQLAYNLTDSASFVGQIVSRGTDLTPNVQWAYGSFKFEKNWEVQVGRKRIPLYYYSDFQDVGISYPWVTPPPELYGWEVTNYNGASLRYTGNVGDASIAASLFGGEEKAKDSLYEKLVYSGKTDVSWTSILGGDLEVTNGPITSRLVYLQSKVRTTNIDNSIDQSASLKAYGIAVNLDLDKWFVLSEYTKLSRDYTQTNYTVTAPAFTIGAGIHLGKWTPFINYARYSESTTDSNQYSPQSFKRPSATLRYDLDSNSSVKIQFDKNTDSSHNVSGNATILRISYDRLF